VHLFRQEGKDRKVGNILRWGATESLSLQEREGGGPSSKLEREQVLTYWGQIACYAGKKKENATEKLGFLKSSIENKGEKGKGSTFKKRET